MGRMPHAKRKERKEAADGTRMKHGPKKKISNCCSYLCLICLIRGSSFVHLRLCVRFRIEATGFRAGSETARSRNALKNGGQSRRLDVELR